ncbi:acyl-CoA synthetase [Bordetella sp. H567]|uniref:acetate--CoA ligase family protein n=1 Tax=Bordetella sp. H567 TaxID=1697043 RepID=UPI00081C8511|nr:acetate--CoA ligase family protein [Bordetella sp. H567]AOB33272.1 acyl-CoA synthetase [Bordetella sp. H567]
MPSNSSSSLGQALLAPRAIALVGASGDARKNTARPLRFMRKHDYAGRIYPINAGRADIMGERAYPTLADLPEAVDHVFVMIPGEQVLPVLEQCPAAGARVVTIYSDGFAEAGPEGMARQHALVARARELGVRLLGPNSIGSANLHTGGIISVNAAFEADDLQAGDISMVSQSGSMMGSLLSRAAARGFGFASSVSVGNECDISVGEVVDALVDDPHTRVILLFLETLRQSTVLAAALRRAREAGKPVVAYKLGRSEQGDALSQSHTGAMAGNDAAVDAFFRAHGVLRVQQLETLFEIVPLAARYRDVRAAAATAARPDTTASGAAPASATLSDIDGSASRAPRVAVITTTGGGAATVVDNLGMRGLVAAAPPPAFVAHMAGRGLRIRETPVIDLTLAATPAQYKDLLEQLLLADWCDAVLSVIGSSAQFHPDFAVNPLVQAHKPDNKPMAAFLAPEAPASLALLRQNGIAAFRTPEACADALAVLFQRRPAPAPAAAQTPFLWPPGMPRTGALTEYEASQVFQALGVPVARSCLVPAGDPAHGLAYPVVAKVSSRDVPHKTDAGAVRVGIGDDAQLRDAIATMLDNVHAHVPGATIDGILVQVMEGRLLELILGYRLDPLVGPTVVLGAGGIAAELNPDFAIRLAPVSVQEAHAMIDEVRATRLVRGFRGLPRGDCDALARAIAAFSRLALATDVTVAEAEINPLFIRADGVVAVDGLLHMQ